MTDFEPVARTRQAVRQLLARTEVRDVAVAVSGGADSLALAAAASHVAVRSGLTIHGLIVDHQLQPGSAAVAAAAAEQLHGLGIDDVRILTVTVTGRGSPEAAARKARYDALRSAGLPLVLLGHTLDDQAETVLLGLGRGSGPRSIAGMRDLDLPWGRPFLSVPRATTVAACEALGLTAWEDPHNVDPAYTRVRLRREVLPLLEDVLQGGVAPALARTAAQLRDDAEALDTLAARLLETARIAGDSVAGDSSSNGASASATETRRGDEDGSGKPALAEVQRGGEGDSGDPAPAEVRRGGEGGSGEAVLAAGERRVGEVGSGETTPAPGGRRGGEVGSGEATLAEVRRGGEGGSDRTDLPAEARRVGEGGSDKTALAAEVRRGGGGGSGEDAPAEVRRGGEGGSGEAALAAVRPGGGGGSGEAALAGVRRGGEGGSRRTALPTEARRGDGGGDSGGDSGEAAGIAGQLDVAVLSTEPAALRRRALRRWLLDAGVRELTDAHLRSVDALIGAWRGQGDVWLPGNFAVGRARGRLRVTARRERSGRG